VIDNGNGVGKIHGSAIRAHEHHTYFLDVLRDAPERPVYASAVALQGCERIELLIL
jgi:hypothetical protein